MASYVLALKDDDHGLHVGEKAAFIQHIGGGLAGDHFDPNRVVDLATTWKLFDKEGVRLDVHVDGDTVDLVPVVPEERVAGPVLVARVNFVLARAQAALDERRAEALASTVDATEQTNTTNTRVANGDADAEALTKALRVLSDSVQEARELAEITPYPSIQADLPVVLVALTEDFGSAIHGGPPHVGNAHHNQMHADGFTHP